jgi:sortase A
MSRPPKRARWGVGRTAGIPPRSGSRSRSRKLGFFLGWAGISLLLYAGALLFWRDPATSLYTWWLQRQLSAEFENVDATLYGREILIHDRPVGLKSSLPRTVIPAGFDPKQGRALGRISIPRIGLRMVFVEGTRAADLRKGPGHYEMTPLPGAGKTVAIAGHRTTFGAPFRHIDQLRRGDTIKLSLTYGEFRYRVFAYKIVDRREWSIIRQRRFETLVLSACHPLYSAAQRWVVFARLTS